jgi:hypothetical protein
VGRAYICLSNFPGRFSIDSKRMGRMRSPLLFMQCRNLRHRQKSFLVHHPRQGGATRYALGIERKCVLHLWQQCDMKTSRLKSLNPIAAVPD